MTPGVQFTRGRVPAGNPGDRAVDLGEIRRSEEIIGVLAARAATGSPMLRDPAAALLSALTADVDALDIVRSALPALPSVLPDLPRSSAPVPALQIGAWVRAAAAAVTAGTR